MPKRTRITPLAVAICLLAGPAWAQVEVQIRTEKPQFLAGEPIRARRIQERWDRASHLRERVPSGAIATVRAKRRAQGHEGIDRETVISVLGSSHRINDATIRVNAGRVRVSPDDSDEFWPESGRSEGQTRR